ncbi:MAG TPA: hypothetical protein DCS93_36565 [Microscillaceae bacterium]|nr:hypothetical protein [Microscillaceae bacterium]
MENYTITILSEGTVVDAPLVEVDIQCEVNKIPYARLSFRDGNPAKQTFDLSKTSLLTPGKQLEIKIYYNEQADEEATLFSGIITKHSIEANIHYSYLIVELRDTSFKMTATRRNKLFKEQKDADVFNELISSNKLKAGQIDSPSDETQDLIQYYCSDWDFLLSRADLYGYWVTVSQEKISVLDPKQISTSRAKHLLSYGLSQIYDVNLEINAEHQIDALRNITWQNDSNEINSITQSVNFQSNPGNLVPEDLAQVVGRDTVNIQSLVPLGLEEQRGWGIGKISKTRLAMLQGSVTIEGNQKIQLLDIAELAGISPRFNGNAIITGVRHRISINGWSTDLQFGVSPQSYAQQHQMTALEAGGLLPGIKGLQIGIVESYEKDPQDQFRMRVNIPALETITWARLATIYAGEKGGIYFHPETGDEVIVGFLNDDPRQAIVLGSLHSTTNPPPVAEGEINAENPVKKIQTKAGFQITIDESNEFVSINTPQGQHLKMDDKQKLIELQDVNNNQIKLSESGILLKTEKEIIIEGKTVKITGKDSIDMN